MTWMTWMTWCDHESCKEVISIEVGEPTDAPLEARAAAIASGWFFLDSESFCPKHAPNPCEDANRHCQGSVGTQDDPFLAHFHHEHVLVTLCTYHYGERAAEI